MNERSALIETSRIAWDSLLESLTGLTEELSWAQLDLRPGEYLHTEGSILSQIAHVANGKIIYGSVGFRNTEIRWRELSPKIDSIWPRLIAVTDWLKEAHDYWTDSWTSAEDLEVLRPRFDGSLHPGWKLVATVIHHDVYHAGQIQLMRSILSPSQTPPAPEGDLWEKYCNEFPSW